MTPTPAGSAFDSLRLDAVTDQETLRRVYALPSAAAVRKQMNELTDQTRRLIGCPMPSSWGSSSTIERSWSLARWTAWPSEVSTS
ncbi:hypothetical protein AB0H10_39705, partial [Streptomyces longwoodensis]